MYLSITSPSQLCHPHKGMSCLLLPFQIIRMERLILQTLDFNLVAPTPYTFLLRYLKAAEAEQLQTLGDDPIELIGQTIESLAKVGSHLLLVSWVILKPFLGVSYCLFGTKNTCVTYNKMWLRPPPPSVYPSRQTLLSFTRQDLPCLCIAPSHFCNHKPDIGEGLGTSITFC